MITQQRILAQQRLKLLARCGDPNKTLTLERVGDKLGVAGQLTDPLRTDFRNHKVWLLQLIDELGMESINQLCAQYYEAQQTDQLDSVQLPHGGQQELW